MISIFVEDEWLVDEILKIETEGFNLLSPNELLLKLRPKAVQDPFVGADGVMLDEIDVAR